MSKIIFHNEPRLSEHEVDNKFNQRRIDLVPHIKDFISNHERFRDKEVNITFAQRGVSSLISIIETSGEKLVLKIPLSLTFSLGEVQFLKVWEQAGVKVPHIIEDGKLNKHPYILMDYVDAKILNDAFRKGEMIKKEIYVEMGKILRLMHMPKAEGYGRCFYNRTEFSSFEDWLASRDVQKKIKYVNENNLLGEDHGSLNIALEALIAHVNENKKSSYCHDDFGTANIFATNPLTVFDPNPRFNDGYIDLGRSITMAVANSGHGEAGEQLIKGYFEGKLFNRKALQASVLLNAYMKFPYWHKVKNLERIRNIQEYLVQTKHLLEK